MPIVQLGYPHVLLIQDHQPVLIELVLIMPLMLLLLIILIVIIGYPHVQLMDQLVKIKIAQIMVQILPYSM